MPTGKDSSINVAVLLGGDSAERDVSIDSGRAIARALAARGREVVVLDPVISSDPLPFTDLEALGDVGRRPPDLEEIGSLDPRALLLAAEKARSAGCRVVFLALHGGKGENGFVQALLEMAGMAYTGSGVIASAVCMNKDISKRLFRDAGLPTPRWLYVELDSTLSSDAPDIVERVSADLGFPAVVKPNDQGSSVGFSYLSGPDDVPAALERVRGYAKNLLFESFIPGREITVGILDGEPLPILEIFPEGGFYDYERKYTGGTSEYRVPAELDDESAERIRQLSRKAFETLRCRDYGRVDLRLSPEGMPFILEVNTLPGMTATSLVPKAAKSVGIEFEDLVERILAAAVST